MTKIFLISNILIFFCKKLEVIFDKFILPQFLSVREKTILACQHTHQPKNRASLFHFKDNSKNVKKKLYKNN